MNKPPLCSGGLVFGGVSLDLKVRVFIFHGHVTPALDLFLGSVLVPDRYKRIDHQKDGSEYEAIKGNSYLQLAGIFAEPVFWLSQHFFKNWR